MPPLKPARWAVTSGMVRQNWKWAWRHSLLVDPQWDGQPGDQLYTAGVFHGQSGWVFSDLEGTSLWEWRMTKYGPCMRMDYTVWWTYLPPDPHIETFSMAVWARFDQLNSQRIFRTSDSASNGIAISQALTTEIWVTYLGVVDIKITIDAWDPGTNPGWYLLAVNVTNGLQEVFVYDEQGLLVSSGSASNTSIPNVSTTQWKWGSGTAEFAALYVWGDLRSEDQIRQLAADPFGPIRPAGTLIVPATPAAPTNTVMLYATADGTISSVVNEVDTTTNLFESVDDDPSSPNDTDFINNTTTSASVFFDLTDTPADFGTMDTLSVTFRLRTQTYASNVSLYAQIFQSDESTSLSDEMLIETATANTSFANDAEVTFTGLNTTAGKSVWDAAKIRLRWA